MNAFFSEGQALKWSFWRWCNNMAWHWKYLHREDNPTRLRRRECCDTSTVYRIALGDIPGLMEMQAILTWLS